MADFRTHVTTSSVLGVGYAGLGIAIGFPMGIPIESSLVAGGLCGVSGMLPDLDSDTGIPIRESMSFAAAIVPMLLVERFRAIGMEHDRIVLIAAVLYFLIRFAGASLLGRFSVHRGMFHSIPAALTFAGAAFLLCGPADDERVRYLKAGAVFLGVMSHLFLDELYSIEWQGGRIRLKRSFGTAIKMWGKNGWANFSAYAKLVVVGIMVAGESSVMQHFEARHPQFASDIQRVKDVQEEIFDAVRDRVIPSRGPMAASDTPAAERVVSPEDSPLTIPDWPRGPSAGFPAETSPTPTPGGFTPNAGRAELGSANPVYRADANSFSPR